MQPAIVVYWLMFFKNELDVAESEAIKKRSGSNGVEELPSVKNLIFGPDGEPIVT